MRQRLQRVDLFWNAKSIFFLIRCPMMTMHRNPWLLDTQTHSKWRPTRKKFTFILYSLLLDFFFLIFFILKWMADSPLDQECDALSFGFHCCSLLALLSEYVRVPHEPMLGYSLWMVHGSVAPNLDPSLPAFCPPWRCVAFFVRFFFFFCGEKMGCCCCCSMRLR